MQRMGPCAQEKIMSDTQNPNDEPESGAESESVEVAPATTDHTRGRAVDAAPEAPTDAAEEAAPSVATGPVGPSAPTSRRRIRRSTLVLSGVIAVTVIALVAMIAISVNTSRSLAASESQVIDLETQVADLDSELEAMTTSRDQYRENSTNVSEREIAVSKLEDEVEAREKAVKTTEEHIAATTLEDGYAYTVGLTMEPGTYEANASGTRCYWSITVTGTNYDDIVQNDLGKAGVLRVTVGGGQDFQSSSCGDWHKVG
jgi:hypothetical protein